jgi:hypothetical protein
MKFKLLLCWIILSIISACSTEAAIQGVLNRKTTVPLFLECKAVSSTEICFRFSQPVKMLSLFFEPFSEVLSVREGEELLVTLTKPLREGEKITADVLVEDEHRNTINVLVPFRARNDRVPKLVINELRTVYSNPRVEFVEFLSQSAGNLGALRLFAAGHSITKPVYEFPPLEIRAGEYIVLHMRSREEDCVDETGDNLALSGGYEALATVRDFWVPGTAKLLHDDNVVYLVDQDDRIIDAVLLSKSPGPVWSKPALATAAEFVASQGAWLPLGGEAMAPGTYTLSPADAASTANTTATRTINRDETFDKGGRAENWYITANSSSTSGMPNNTKRFVPK